MPSDETGESGFPGFQSIDGFFELWFAGAKDYVDAWNRIWDGATSDKASYSFGRWSKDIAGLWASSFRSVEKLAKYPVLAALGGAPVWATIIVDKDSETGSSKWVDLPKTVGQPDPTPTALECLGASNAKIPVESISVRLNNTRDRMRVSLKDLKKFRAQNKPAGGTYVGFARQSRGSGAPLAVIFVSLDE